MEDTYGIQGVLKSNIQFIAQHEGTTEQFALRDILTDLRHAANNMGLDFDVAVEGSSEVFAVESTEG